ncbi:MAG: AraC family transcriptional regulator ligand-binding domain-containing protein [Polyangiales bacterium]
MAEPILGQGAYPIPIVYLVSLQEFAAERGVAPHDFLRGTDIPLRALVQKNVRVGDLSVRIAIANLLDSVDDPMLAIDFGRNQSITDHGLIGFAAKHSHTLLDAARLVCEFFDIEYWRHEDVFELVEQRATLAIRLKIDGFDHRADVARFSCDVDARQLETLARRLIGATDEHISTLITLTSEPPGPIETSRLSQGLEIRFEQPFNELRIPLELANRPILMADTRLVDAAMADIEDERLRLSSRYDVVSRVRMILRNSERRSPAVEDVAAQLRMSPRTLKRRLSDAGTSFRIKHSELFRRAIDHLENSDMDLESVARELRYSDANASLKRLKTWAGVTPGAYRKRLDELD